MAAHQRRVSDPPRMSRQPWLIENDSESLIHYWNKLDFYRSSQHQITDCFVNHRLENVHEEGLD